MKDRPDRLITLTFDDADYAVFKAEIARRDVAFVEADMPPGITSKSCLRAYYIACLIRELACFRNAASIATTLVVSLGSRADTPAVDPCIFKASLDGSDPWYWGRTPAEAVGKLAIFREATLGLDILRLDLAADSEETA